MNVSKTYMYMGSLDLHWPILATSCMKQWQVPATCQINYE